MRYAARVDSNQAEIVQAMRDAGASVFIVGLPVDLLVGHAGKTALVEVKRREGKRQTPYTQLQKGFMLDWKGGTVATIVDVAGALALLKVMEA